MNNNLILDALPVTVEIDGEEYEINSDFRTGMTFELMMQNDSLDDRTKLELTLQLYYPVCPPNVIAALKKAMWFYRCGEEPRKNSSRRDEDEDDAQDQDAEPGAIAYSFEHDHVYFVAAFWQQYHIDLTEEDMHWWKFRALFRGLNEDCQLVKIMGYRTTKITDKMSKSEKERLRKMKKIYRLPMSDAEQEHNRKLTEALMNGGDLTGLI